MRGSSLIKQIVSKLIKQCGTNNPFEIAAQKNITVLYEDLGSTLGFYFTYKRIKFIHIHHRLSEEMQRFVCAHELGHAILHPKENTIFMRSSTFFSVDRIEREANTFAIQLLTYNKGIYEGESLEQFYRRCNVPVEFSEYL